MSVYRVVDKLETTVKEGVWLPFGARIVNQDRMLDLIEKLRSSLPEELSRAKALIAERDRLLEQTKATVGAGPTAPSVGSNAAAVIAPVGAGPNTSPAGTSPAATSNIDVPQSEILRKAQEQANAMIAQAHVTAKDIRRGADEYADQVLSTMDTSLGNALAVIKKGRQTLASSLSAGNGIARTQQRRP